MDPSTVETGSNGLGFMFVAIALVMMTALFIIATMVSKAVRRARGIAIAPEATQRASVVAKREGQTSGYYATFEFPDGQRQEFVIWGQEYGLLAVGDAGMLTHKGESYQRFIRDEVPQVG